VDVNVEKSIIEYLLENGYNTKWAPDLDCKMIDENSILKTKQAIGEL